MPFVVAPPRPVSFAVVAALLIGLDTAPTTVGAQEVPTPVEVDGAVQVTAEPSPSRAHMGPVVALHPESDQVLALAEADVVGGQCSVHVSTNAGLSWRQVSRPDTPSRWQRCAYHNIGPIVDIAFGPDGTLHYAFSGYDPGTEQSRVFLARSDDLGSSWDVTELPAIERDLAHGQLGRDAIPSVAVDPNEPNNVYVGWTSNWAAWTVRPLFESAGREYYWDVTMRPYVAASRDGGETFTEPVSVAQDLWLTETVEGMKSPPDLLVGNDGEVFAFFGESARVSPEGTREEPGEHTAPASVYVAVSEDGGKTYEGRRVYSEPPPTRASTFLWSPAADIDRDTGTLYVAWEQLSNAGQPVSILVTASTDGGRTWSEPTQVNDAEPQRTATYMELFPDVSVAPDGRVDMAWFDPRHDPTYSPGDEEEGADNAFHDVYYAYSVDRGATWSPNVRITDRSIDRRIGPGAVGGIRAPLGVASTDGGTYIVWDDSRNGSPEIPSHDIYFTRARQQEPGVFFAAPAAGAANEQLLAGVLGAGAALLVGGMLLLGLSVRTRRRVGAQVPSHTRR